MKTNWKSCSLTQMKGLLCLMDKGNKSAQGKPLTTLTITYAYVRDQTQTVVLVVSSLSTNVPAGHPCNLYFLHTCPIKIVLGF